MKWRPPKKAPVPAIIGASDVARLEPRIGELEHRLDNASRDIASLKVSLASANSRINAAVDLYEHRIDLIYRQIVGELGKALGAGAIQVETDASVDERLARLLSGGLRTPIDLNRIDIGNIISDELIPGTLNAPLTIYGFRLSRERARERGDAIEIASVTESSPGAAVYGPYKRLKPGQYKVTAMIRSETALRTTSVTGDLALDVYSPATGEVVAQTSLNSKELPSANYISVAFQWNTTAAADLIEFRIHQNCNLPIALLAIVLESSEKPMDTGATQFAP